MIFEACLVSEMYGRDEQIMQIVHFLLLPCLVDPKLLSFPPITVGHPCGAIFVHVAGEPAAAAQRLI